LYEEFVPATAAGLKEAGAEGVVLAGHPGDHEASWREAGVDRFIFMKCDVLQTLRELLQQQGVISMEAADDE
jgi:methylmalonyl-CoA mutase